MTEIHLLRQKVHGVQRSTAAEAGTSVSDSPGAQGVAECGIEGWCASIPSSVTCERCRNTYAFREMDAIYAGPECGDQDCGECPGVVLLARGDAQLLRHMDVAIEAVIDHSSLMRRVVAALECEANYWEQWELATDVFERITPDMLKHVADDGYIPEWVYDWFKRRQAESDPL